MDARELLSHLFNGVDEKQMRKAFSEAIMAIAEQSKTNDDNGPEHIQVLIQVQEVLEGCRDTFYPDDQQGAQTDNQQENPEFSVDSILSDILNNKIREVPALDDHQVIVVLYPKLETTLTTT